VSSKKSIAIIGVAERMADPSEPASTK